MTGLLGGPTEGSPAIDPAAAEPAAIEPAGLDPAARRVVRRAAIVVLVLAAPCGCGVLTSLVLVFTSPAAQDPATLGLIAGVPLTSGLAFAAARTFRSDVRGANLATRICWALVVLGILAVSRNIRGGLLLERWPELLGLLAGAALLAGVIMLQQRAVQALTTPTPDSPAPDSPAPDSPAPDTPAPGAPVPGAPVPEAVALGAPASDDSSGSGGPAPAGTPPPPVPASHQVPPASAPPWQHVPHQSAPGLVPPWQQVPHQSAPGLMPPWQQVPHHASPSQVPASAHGPAGSAGSPGWAGPGLGGWFGGGVPRWVVVTAVAVAGVVGGGGAVYLVVGPADFLGVRARPAGTGSGAPNAATGAPGAGPGNAGPGAPNGPLMAFDPCAISSNAIDVAGYEPDRQEQVPVKNGKVCRWRGLDGSVVGVSLWNVHRGPAPGSVRKSIGGRIGDLQCEQGRSGDPSFCMFRYKVTGGSVMVDIQTSPEYEGEPEPHIHRAVSTLAPHLPPAAN